MPIAFPLENWRKPLGCLCATNHNLSDLAAIIWQFRTYCEKLYCLLHVLAISCNSGNSYFCLYLHVILCTCLGVLIVACMTSCWGKIEGTFTDVEQLYLCSAETCVRECVFWKLSWDSWIEYKYHELLIMGYCRRKWHFFVWLGILENFDRFLERNINSVSRDEKRNFYRKEDGCKSDSKKSCESKSLHLTRSWIPTTNKVLF